MIIVIGVTTTEGITKEIFNVKGTSFITDVHWWKDRQGNYTIGFKENLLIYNMNYFQDTDSYYLRQGKKHNINVFLLDTDTNNVVCNNLYELTRIIKSGRQIYNVSVQQNIVNIYLDNIDAMYGDYNAFFETSCYIMRNYIISRPELSSFILKNKLVQKQFYIVKLVEVNGNKNFKFELNKYDKYELKIKSLLNIFNSRYKLEFYTKSGILAYRVVTNYFCALIFYMKAHGLKYFFQQNNKEILYDNQVLYDTLSSSNKEKKGIFYYAKQTCDYEMQEVCKDVPIQKEFQLIYGIPLRFECDNSSFLQLPYRSLMESFKN